ncbi:7,8-didemethyl-8-hydroxy-5-deazariboflavin synthase subunit CofG [Terasakiispira papahanaumokuakeensis]|uniref:7,8-didemethyl-8-hydroxy-5-deazariboflavin synthase n=1 Tax=Terasakiispira papahanaumokuakeensis TaxID=197479 RepID=A0A1E2VBR8_9GAMM|nr:7,8-didemethyl-8-hydroxy-5-deazariboflavin synthase CofG [Terasakiispira papahanaumokuakeensis]ODC04312.1 7,8-didemethyl-8-hydroxy-5-deazariboflavin synthase subunit CofG [Terasakiispira papahanaumokuakeensis]
MISRKEAIALGGIQGKELDDLCEYASQVRDQTWGKQLTYSRKVFIPLTNMCRDRCGYCTFVKGPQSPEAQVMTETAVMHRVQQGEASGCREALFSLGERPEKRYPQLQHFLEHHGFRRLIDYLAHCAEQVLAKSTLLPHLNPGTLTRNELRQLKPVSASMGMMLESASQRLLRPGQAHHRCPDKVPNVRLKTLDDAGRLAIPFTTGLLIGIGETWQERIEALLLINALHQQHGHIQEVIIQNFRAKPGTAMAHCHEPDLDDMRRTLAVARLLLSPRISLQAPPNLHADYPAYIRSGLNDWGGISPVTQDHINPERAWPQIDHLATACQAQGYTLKQRLTVYPDYLKRPAFIQPLGPKLIAMSSQLNATDALNPIDQLTRGDGLSHDPHISHPMACTA